MADPSVRIVRRGGALVASLTHSPARPPAALVAASAPVTNSEQLFKSGVSGGRRNNWQQECRDMARIVGELRFYVNWLSKSCSRVRFVASEVDPDTGLPTGSISEDNTEGQFLAELVRQIADGALGQVQLIKRVAANLTVVGEIWIMLLNRPDGLKWYAITNREIEQGTRHNTATIKLPDGTKHTFDPAAGDGAFRVWNPDDEDATLPDCPIRANLDPLREIVRTTKKIRNIDNSRLANNGILAIASEASLPNPQAPVSADKPGEDSPTTPMTPALAYKLQQMIFDVAKIAHEDPDSAAALLPIIITMPAEHIDKIKHITFGKDMAEVELKKRNDAIMRLAMGLDVSPERLLGIGATTNHWSAWAVGDEDVQLHISPVMETICQSIYDNVFRNVLAAKGIKPGKYMLWYDTSQLTVDPDKTDEARDAFDRGTITGEALVRHFGLPDESLYDFTSLEGWQQWAQDKVSQDPTQLRTLLPLLDKSLQDLEFPEPAALPPADDSDDDDDKSGAGKQQEPDTEDDNQQSAAATAMIPMAVELMITKTLELAGKRRRTRADYSRLANVPMHETHRYLPPVAAAEIPELVKGWDNGLDELAARFNVNAHAVRMLVLGEVERKLTAEVVDG